MQEYSFAQTLKTLRKKKGVSQKDLAFFLSVSNKTVSKWEKGITSPDLSLLPPLAKYFGVSTDYLLGQSEEKQPGSAPRAVSDEEIKFALFGGDGEITDAMFDEVKQFAAFIKQREAGKKE